MNNVFLDELPTSWNGYEVNTWFQIGIQIQLLKDDEELSQVEKSETILQLLFGNSDGQIREFPPSQEEFQECLNWFMNGWYHDNDVKSENRIRLMDYDVDQWRIYADFLQIYGIDLREADLHWWAFNGLLWNMPNEKSSFMQVLQIRQKKPHKHASAEERKAIDLGHKIYDLKKKTVHKEYSSEEKKAIDDYDAWMESIKRQKAQKKEIEKQAEAIFRNTI
jgi:hypothetical protein